MVLFTVSLENENELVGHALASYCVHLVDDGESARSKTVMRMDGMGQRPRLFPDDDRTQKSARFCIGRRHGREIDFPSTPGDVAASLRRTLGQLTIIGLGSVRMVVRDPENVDIALLRNVAHLHFLVFAVSYTHALLRLRAKKLIRLVERHILCDLGFHSFSPSTETPGALLILVVISFSCCLYAIVAI